MEFTSLGTVQIIDGHKRVVPFSMSHLRQNVNRFNVGDKIRSVHKVVKPAHTESQHAFHFVLCGYIADHTGHTVDEVHDWMMKETFGTKYTTILGRKREARESMSKAAQLSVGKVVELINKDLDICAELGIRVPTMQELGFISNK